jgi:23S rRNA pseudouridine1911/1915/1917 synthase
LFEQIPSRNSAKKAIKAGLLLINGTAGQTGSWIAPGQRIELFKQKRTPPKAYGLPLQIIYEDAYLAVINKPAGVPTSGNQFKTIQNALLANISPSEKKNALDWPLPVHRLDSATSGLLLVAKTIDARVALGSAFESKEIQKTYRAVVMGETPQEGIIDFPIEGQPAVSHYRLIRSVPSLQNRKLSLLELSPQTGRTHQLRIHTAKAGFPILGDTLYAGENTLKGKGLFLCAVSLRLTHPVTNKPLLLSIEEPKKFGRRMEIEQQMWERYNEAKG